MILRMAKRRLMWAGVTAHTRQDTPSESVKRRYDIVRSRVDAFRATSARRAPFANPSPLFRPPQRSSPRLRHRQQLGGVDGAAPLAEVADLVAAAEAGGHHQVLR